MKNLQGDIIALVDEDCNTVVRYKYDAWGKCTITCDNSGVGIATVNPYRYRGYYYDTETHLYYLQSRYYDPETGRFINADEAVIQVRSCKSTARSLFGYAVNSPLKRHDPFGFESLFINLIDGDFNARSACENDSFYCGIQYYIKEDAAHIHTDSSLLNKEFCLQLSSYLIGDYEKNGKKAEVSSKELAKEIFAHEVLYQISIFLAIEADISDAMIISPPSDKVTTLGSGNLGYSLISLISSLGAEFLNEHAEPIDISFVTREKWYRRLVYDILWGISGLADEIQDMIRSIKNYL